VPSWTASERMAARTRHSRALAAWKKTAQEKRKAVALAKKEKRAAAREAKEREASARRRAELKQPEARQAAANVAARQDPTQVAAMGGVPLGYGLAHVLAGLLPDPASFSPVAAPPVAVHAAPAAAVPVCGSAAAKRLAAATAVATTAARAATARSPRSPAAGTAIKRRRSQRHTVDQVVDAVPKPSRATSTAIPAAKRARRTRNAVCAAANGAGEPPSAAHFPAYTPGTAVWVEYDCVRYDAVVIATAVTRMKVCYCGEGTFEFVPWHEVRARVSLREAVC